MWAICVQFFVDLGIAVLQAALAGHSLCHNPMFWAANSEKVASELVLQHLGVLQVSQVIGLFFGIVDIVLSPDEIIVAIRRRRGGTVDVVVVIGHSLIV